MLLSTIEEKTDFFKSFLLYYNIFDKFCSAIENYRKEGFETFVNSPQFLAICLNWDSYIQMINYSLCWKDTKDGFDFWSRNHLLWKNDLKKNSLKEFNIKDDFYYEITNHKSCWED